MNEEMNNWLIEKLKKEYERINVELEELKKENARIKIQLEYYSTKMDRDTYRGFAEGAPRRHQELQDRIAREKMNEELSKIK